MDAIVKIIDVQVLQYILQAVVLRRQIKKLIKEGERRVELGKVYYDVGGGLVEPANALLHFSYRSKAYRIFRIGYGRTSSNTSPAPQTREAAPLAWVHAVMACVKDLM